MAARPTRRKIRDQGNKVNQDLQRVLGHLKFLDDLADGGSGYINENLPRIVVMMEGVCEVIEGFTDGL